VFVKAGLWLNGWEISSGMSKEDEIEELGFREEIECIGTQKQDIGTPSSQFQLRMQVRIGKELKVDRRLEECW